MNANRNRQITVCHIYKTYLPDTMGGLEKVIEQICRQCDPAQVESRVITLSRLPLPPVLSRPEAEIHRFPITIDIASSPMSFAMLKGFRRAVADADILHYHFPWPFADLAHIFTRPGKPALVTYHSDILRQKWLKILYRPLMRRFLVRMDRIVVTSPNYLESSDDLIPYRDKIEVIPICLDEIDYPKPEPLRLQYWGHKLGRGFFLFIGVLRYYKGLSVLLDAVRGTDKMVVIVGSGPMEKELRRRKKDEGLDNIILLGFLGDEDKMALLELCRAVVFPSHLRTEAFGVTLVEGAMAGRPLISTEIGTGTSFVNQDGETGIVVPPSDPVALRAAMERLSDVELATVMGRAARGRFKELFSAPRMGLAYTDLYRRILDGVS